MKKIKYLLLVIDILLFSGFTWEYNLKFIIYLTVSEELNVSIENTDDNFDRTYRLFENAGIDPDKYDVVVVDDKIKINYKEDYKSFEKYYLDSKLYSALFEEIEFTKDNTGMSISTKSNLKLDDKNNKNIINSYDIDDFKINIKVPFSVDSSNADSVKDDVYTWTLSKDDTFKKIILNYSFAKGKTQNIITLVIIGIAILATIGYIASYLIKNRKI